MFEYSYTQVKEMFTKDIAYINEESYTIIMEDTNTIGRYPISDIILVFSPQGELVIYAERVYKSNYSWLQMLRIKIKSLLNVDLSSNEVNTTVTFKRKYLDVIMFKRWWYEWAKELL